MKYKVNFTLEMNEKVPKEFIKQTLKKEIEKILDKEQEWIYDLEVEEWQ